MDNRFQVLDGWRGLSILFVLLGHWFPLGPKEWQMNTTIAAVGMVCFFILSGFLITNILLKDQNIGHFLTRRFLRIVPLAWLVMLITFLITSPATNVYLPHFLFYANWPPIWLTDHTAHFWSLCIELQFYLLIAILVGTLKQRAFKLLPLLCVAVTCYRYFNDAPANINTYYRIDEILAGCILALIYRHPADTLKRWIAKLNPVYLLPLLVFSAHPEAGLVAYFRPYIALLVIGSSLFATQNYWYHPWLKGRILFYIASVSYAVYVLHVGLAHTWLGEGNTLEKYLKRPLLLAVTFGLAHLSTFYYEKYWINLGKKLTSKLALPPEPKPYKIIILNQH
jgi:peptidoglycan/LPS O-acetylase OafA/YrhL